MRFLLLSLPLLAVLALSACLKQPPEEPKAFFYAPPQYDGAGAQGAEAQ